MLYYQREKRLPFLAVAAYWIIASVPPPDEPCAQGHQDTQVRQPQRASRSVYQVNATFVQDELLGATNGHQTEQARAAQRAKSSTYWIDQRPTAQFDTGIPASQGTQDWTPRPAARSAKSAYWIEQRPIWLELGNPAANGYQDWTPRQPPRAGKAAYQFTNRTPSDEQPVTWGHQTAESPAAQRAKSTAYWIEHVAEIEGPDKPASDGSQTERVHAPRRANSDAYRLIVPMVRDEPEIPSGYQELSRRGLRRAPPSAYWLEQRAAIADQSAPVAFGHQTEDAPAARRAAASAYAISQCVPIAEVPAANGYVETASRSAKRARNDAYFVSLPFKGREVGVPAAFGHQTEAAKAARRASPAAYQVYATVAVDEPRSPGAIVLPEVVRRASRADAEAYRLEIFSQTDEQLPPGRGSVTLRAHSARRAAKSAYLQQCGVQPSENNLVQPQLDQTTRSLRRAGRLAYWIPDTTHIRGLGVPAGTGWIDGRHAAARRASQDAYRAILAEPQQADFMLPARGFQQERARQASRAANAAYLVAITPALDSLPTEGKPVLPQNTPDARRASKMAYDALLSPVVHAEPCTYGYQAGGGQVRRAAKTAYDIHADVVPPEVPADFGYIEQTARDLRRSAIAAYWLPQSFQVVGVDVPASWGYQEQRSMRLLRAPLASYVVLQLFATPEILRTGPLEQVYGCSSELRQVYGGSSELAQVYGEEAGTNQMRGAT